jgi:hypothetical protein
MARVLGNVVIVLFAGGSGDVATRYSWWWPFVTWGHGVSDGDDVATRHGGGRWSSLSSLWFWFAFRVISLL